jgi:hypothetical protein
MPLGQKRSSISGLGRRKSDPPRGEENPKHGGYRVDSWHLIGKQWSHGDIHPNKEAAERQVARMVKAGFKPQWVRIVEMTNSTPPREENPTLYLSSSEGKHRVIYRGTPVMADTTDLGEALRTLRITAEREGLPYPNVYWDGDKGKFVSLETPSGYDKPHKLLYVTYYELPSGKWEVPSDRISKVEYAIFDTEEEARNYIAKSVGEKPWGKPSNPPEKSTHPPYMWILKEYEVVGSGDESYLEPSGEETYYATEEEAKRKRKELIDSLIQDYRKMGREIPPDIEDWYQVVRRKSPSSPSNPPRGELYTPRYEPIGEYWTVIFNPAGIMMGRYSEREARRYAEEKNALFSNAESLSHRFVGSKIGTFDASGRLMETYTIVSVAIDPPGGWKPGTHIALLDNGKEIIGDRGLIEREIAAIKSNGSKCTPPRGERTWEGWTRDEETGWYSEESRKRGDSQTYVVFITNFSHGTGDLDRYQAEFGQFAGTTIPITGNVYCDIAKALNEAHDFMQQYHRIKDLDAWFNKHHARQVPHSYDTYKMIEPECYEKWSKSKSPRGER